MSGKATGKKRNRSAQSAQHGYQESPEDHAVKPRVGEAAGEVIKTGGEKQRVLDKMRDLERRRQEKAE